MRCEHCLLCTDYIDGLYYCECYDDYNMDEDNLCPWFKENKQ